MSAETETEVEQVADPAPEVAEPVAGEEALGDAGKKALDAMKAERKAASDRAKAAEAERDALLAQIAGKEAEYAAEQEKQRVKDEALAAANRRIASAELRAAAKGKLADPSDAALFINVDEIDVNDDGEVDTDALNTAIDDLLSRKPHLAATARRFNGDGDGGARPGDPGKKQLTDADLDSMTPAQINQARKNGQLERLLGRKP